MPAKYREEITRLYKSGGYTLDEVGQMVGLTRERVRQIVNECGDAVACERAFYTLSEVCTLVHASRGVVSRAARALGIEVQKGRWIHSGDIGALEDYLHSRAENDRLSEILRRVDITSGCWLWTGATAANGYGIASLNGKRVYLHRLVYEICHGEIVPGMFVCHKCDNPRCCNPDHLFLGTPKENTLDSVRKGRWITEARLVGWRRRRELIGDAAHREKRLEQQRRWWRQHRAKG